LTINLLSLFLQYFNHENMPIALKRFLIISLLLSIAHFSFGQVDFRHDFAPSEGLVRGCEKPYRDEICLNGLWNFKAEGDADWDKVKIRIPSPWNANSFAYNNLEGPDHRDFPSYPQRWNDVKDAWMQKTVRVPESWTGSRILLHFEAVAGKTEVFANGRKVADNFDLFLPFEADLTDIATPGKDVEILVHVQSEKLFEDTSTIGRRIIPAGSMWGTHINGIWQDVYLMKVPQVRISDIFIESKVSEGVLRLTVQVRNDTPRNAKVGIGGTVSEWINRAGTDIINAPVPAWELGQQVIEIPKTAVSVQALSTDTVRIDVSADLLEWTPETPNLYGLQLGLWQGRRQSDEKYERFGWREWTFEGTKLCLNGKPIQLRGDSWHFMGIPQMTRRYAWAWYTAIKDMNGNAVRLHAQVYPRFYMDVADEMGICVLEETANWGSDGGPKFDSDAFWAASKTHLAGMVRRDRNHPSIFGWSVSNENRPVILYVFKRPDLMPYQKQAWKDWVGIVRENDPSRPWISSDGEDDGEGILPVTVGHYGDSSSMAAWKAIGKPWGVGEHGMAYYGTPKEVSKYNGERAYESMEGRMEGIAKESWNLIYSMRNMGASYSTVFNMAWYALKPLAFGKKDVSTPPSMDDGIFFPEYKEGVPGVQPERLGPYSSTLNPGYDPSLPLYEPWPMFDALRAVNAPDGPAWSPWTEVKEKAEEAIPEAPEYESVIFVGDSGGRLAKIFKAQGVQFDSKPSGRTLYIIDATSKQELPDTKGADRWFWGLNPETAEYFGLEVTLTPLKRSSFLPTGLSWSAGMKNSDFYFCEDQKEDACEYTLSGRVIDEGTVILRACRTDWRKWNKRGEDMKTAATIRSEYETTVPLTVFVKCGSDYYSTIDDFLSSEKGYDALSKLIRNAGIRTEETTKLEYGEFDDGIYQSGILTRPVK
jgi:hypothetical protein